MPPSKKKKTVGVKDEYQPEFEKIVKMWEDELIQMKAIKKDAKYAAMAEMDKSVDIFLAGCKNVADMKLEDLDATPNVEAPEIKQEVLSVPRANHAEKAAEQLHTVVREKAPIAETVLRPPLKKNLLNNLITPAFGARNNLPKFITPKVANIIAETQMRPQREGEITFSVDGSPVVKSNATASDKLAQVMEADEVELTPESRQLQANIKQLLRKKEIEANQMRGAGDFDDEID